MEKLVELANVDEAIGKGIAGFFGETCINFISMLVEKAKALPRRTRDQVPLIKLVSEVESESKKQKKADCPNRSNGA